MREEEKMGAEKIRKVRRKKREGEKEREKERKKERKESQREAPRAPPHPWPQVPLPRHFRLIFCTTHVVSQ